MIYLEKDGRTWRLDEVSTIIWDNIDGRQTVRGICQAVASAYPDVPPSQIAQDVVAFLRLLTEQGFVQTDAP
ncbi:PqqD family protein [Micromonospora sp. NPDC006766]|uniref:PqqD family protein n=1 Tax=Micromonospora sp. NPDC006766 TaxID=3154778 RepID=UPI0033D71C15